ncbi:MAG: methyl-accepting chemotaxis protein, partial [Thermotogota bacterium]|nr:methyl-accepting chemotaxis protein [Thermotogota bacterium]
MRFKKLSTLVTTVAVLAVVIVVGVILAITYSVASSEIRNQKVESIKYPVELVYSLVEQIYQQEKSGQLTHEEAVRKVKELVSPMRFQDNSNYVFIFDSNYIGVVHPTLEGKDGSTIQDKNPDEKKRVYVIKDLVDGARKNGEFILDYYWDKIGKEGVYLKISWAKWFEPYQWAIGADVYGDDIQKNVMALVLPMLYTGIAAVVVVILVLYFIGRRLGKATATIETAVSTVADGDLTHAFEIDRADELGRIGEAIKKMIEELKDVLRNIHESSEQTNASAQNLAAVAEEQEAATREVAQVFEHIAEELQNISATLEEVNSGVEEVASSAQSVSKSAQELAERSETVTQSLRDGVQAVSAVTETVRQSYEDVQKTAEQVNELASQAKNIGEIVETISAIAEQT